MIASLAPQCSTDLGYSSSPAKDAVVQFCFKHGPGLICSSGGYQKAKPVNVSAALTRRAKADEFTFSNLRQAYKLDPITAWLIWTLLSAIISKIVSWLWDRASKDSAVRSALTPYTEE
jgi:hypothetical protein